VDREPITVSFVIRDLPALHHIMRFTLYHKPLVIASDDGAAEVQFPLSSTATESQARLGK